MAGRGFHLLEDGNWACNRAAICLYFFRLFQLNLLEMFHRGLLFRLGPAVLRIGELVAARP